jgi:hypothetical protein
VQELLNDFRREDVELGAGADKWIEESIEQARDMASTIHFYVM